MSSSIYHPMDPLGSPSEYNRVQLGKVDSLIFGCRWLIALVLPGAVVVGVGLLLLRADLLSQLPARLGQLLDVGELVILQYNGWTHWFLKCTLSRVESLRKVALVENSPH